MKQQQFLEVLDRDEAEARWHEPSIDRVAERHGRRSFRSSTALGRVLAEDVRAGVDVPGFDRANMDGFAVRAADTFGAAEEEPVRLRINAETIPTGVAPQTRGGEPGTATPIATGGMLPRGADAVVRRSSTRTSTTKTRAHRHRAQCAHAGRRGLVRGHRHGARRDGALRRHAPHLARDWAYSPRSGCETVPVRAPARASRSSRPATRSCSRARRCGPGSCSTATAGSWPTPCANSAANPSSSAPSATTSKPPCATALERGDRRTRIVVLLSGGTSKGEGDLNGRVVGELDPGHHRARRRAQAREADLSGRGKARKPVVILPGLPDVRDLHLPRVRRTRAAPRWPGSSRRASRARCRRAPGAEGRRRRATAVASSTLLVGLVQRAEMAGSLRVSRWARAAAASRRSAAPTASSASDATQEIVEADTPVEVTLIGREVPVADLVVVGSHCAGLDAIASALAREGFRREAPRRRVHRVGLAAAEPRRVRSRPLPPARSGERPSTTAPFLKPGLALVPGYTPDAGRRHAAGRDSARRDALARRPRRCGW